VSDLKHSKFGVITLLLFGMVIALTGIVCADQPVPATPETQTLGTVTTADVDGLAMETDAGLWALTTSGQPEYIYINFDSPSYIDSAEAKAQLIAGGGYYTSGPKGEILVFMIPVAMLDTIVAGTGITWGEAAQNAKSSGYSETYTEGGLHQGALDPWEVRYTTAYDANIVAQAGHTVLTKSMNIDTRNKVIGQSNIKADTTLTFIATADGGNVVGSENIMLDGAGNATTAADRMLCPFASAGGNVIPAYCNIVQAGSKYDLTIGSVTTAANNKFVGSDATIPVVLNYAVNVKPYTASGTQAPAIGSAMAYIKAHIQESNNITATKAEDLTYSETSSANGYINSFNKVIAYQSGKSLL
jgi:hypothetical protein